MIPDESPPAAWVRVRVDAPEDPELRALWVDVLMEWAHQGVVEESGHLVGYLPARGAAEDEDPRPGEILRALRDRTPPSVPPPGLTVEHQDHQAWEEIWREGFKPRRITPRLVVAPSWSDPDPGEGEILLTLDPGMAFGTAEHPTTRGCLRLMDGRVLPGQRIADVGAGSGILSIAAALLGADRVLAVELDPWSAEVARENALLNGVSGQVEVRAGRVTEAGLAGEPAFDGLVSNIEAGVLGGLLPGLAASVAAGGWIVLSGILEDERDRVIEQAAALGLEPDGDDLEEGWWSGAFRVPAGQPTGELPT